CHPECSEGSGGFFRIEPPTIRSYMTHWLQAERVHANNPKKRHPGEGMPFDKRKEKADQLFFGSSFLVSSFLSLSPLQPPQLPSARSVETERVPTRATANNENRSFFIEF